jgi:hypothetical protein
MKSQVFKKIIPLDILFELLSKICNQENNYFILNIESYKKGTYDNTINIFIENIKDYYHNSKKFYVERKLSYTSFANIIRQICKSHELEIKNTIKYYKCDYNIEYSIKIHE